MAASETFNSLELSKYENDCKTFQWQQCGCAFRKSYLKKLKNVLARKVYEEAFPENFKKSPQKKTHTHKKKLSEKLLTGLVSMNIFTDMFSKWKKTYLQISFKTIFFKML